MTEDITKIPWARPAIDEAELREVVATMESGWLTSGPRVERFETMLAGRVGRKHAIAVSNGTAALELALHALGITRGDEVIMPALTYIATANAVMLAGATPVFVDIDPRHYGVCPKQVEAHITPRTRAVIATDHGGNPCDYTRLSALCQKRGILLMIDGAQSIGTFYQGKPTLSQGIVSTTSFHAAKTITTIEGGMVFTDEDRLAERMRIIRSQGEDPKRKYHHVEIGRNFRVTELNAAIGLAQLSKLDVLLTERQTLAKRYRTLFASLGLASPNVLRGGRNSYFLYSLLVPQRDRVMARLRQRGIETRACYPMPIYRQPIYQNFDVSPCPVAEEVCAGILNPPMFHGLTAAQQHRVADELTAAIDELAVSRSFRKAV